jgi:two-component system, cell cycle sensor histidine kinase and response regulator CckA
MKQRYPSGDPDRAELRRRAEREAQALESEDIDAAWPVEARRVLHELQVHQIELEIQNEELRSAREQLEASRERYFNLYDLAPVGYVSLSETGMILEANLTAASLLGIPRGSLSRQRLSGFIFPEDEDTYYFMIRNLSKTGSPQTCELRMRKKGGAHFWARLDAAAAKDVGGAPCWRVVITDITDRKRAQEESFARQKLESVGSLASGIAHDFNNLLGGMLAQAELALDEYQAGLSPEEGLKGIRDGAIRGSEIVRQLMIYAGKEIAVAGLVDVSQIAREMIELLKVSVSKRAALVADFGQALPAVRGSAGQIRQIVMNLVTNASEALEDRDGVIRVSTQRVNVDQAEAVSKGIAEGDYVQLEVADTGRGMSLETQGRVFDPFFTTKSQGHGLGLGVVRGIVRDLGGVIHLSSELGKGTRFQIFLRSTGIMTLTRSPLPPVGESSPPPIATILVVEDHDALRVALAQILRRRGFEPLDAANGSDAIRLLRANAIKIDVMLLDTTIPGPSSHDVAAVAGEVRPGLKVVLTSAYDEKSARDAVSATEAYSFIRKPFQIDELVQILRNTLSSPASRANANPAF